MENARKAILSEDKEKYDVHWCSKSVELLVFTKWIQKYSGAGPLLEITPYMCSLHYEGTNRYVPIQICRVWHYPIKVEHTEYKVRQTDRQQDRQTTRQTFRFMLQNLKIITNTGTYVIASEFSSVNVEENTWEPSPVIWKVGSWFNILTGWSFSSELRERNQYNFGRPIRVQLNFTWTIHDLSDNFSRKLEIRWRRKAEPNTATKESPLGLSIRAVSKSASWQKMRLEKRRGLVR